MIDLLKVLFERKLNKGPSRKSFCTKPSYCSLHQFCSIFNFFFGQLKLEHSSIVVPRTFFTLDLISIDLENCGINFLDFAAKINSKTLSQKKLHQNETMTALLCSSLFSYCSSAFVPI